MDSTRRGFLASLAAALTLDPERLLWVPGKRVVSIPKPARVGVTLTELLAANVEAVRKTTMPRIFELQYQNHILTAPGWLNIMPPSGRDFRVPFEIKESGHVRI